MSANLCVILNHLVSVICFPIIYFCSYSSWRFRNSLLFILISCINFIRYFLLLLLWNIHCTNVNFVHVDWFVKQCWKLSYLMPTNFNMINLVSYISHDINFQCILKLLKSDIEIRKKNLIFFVLWIVDFFLSSPSTVSYILCEF